MKGDPPTPPPPANIDRLGLGVMGADSPTLQQHGARAPEMVSVDYLQYLSKRRAEDRAQREYRQATQEHNERVAGIILPGGGHVGFAAYAKEYYYSLIANFFDPVTGAGAACGP